MSVKGFPSWNNCGCGTSGGGSRKSHKTKSHKSHKTRSHKSHKSGKSHKSR